MVTCIILVILWVLYTVALGKFFFYVCDLPPAPIFDIDSLGLCSGLVLALAGWLGFSIFVGAYLFGCP
jgi:hypothetical protein